MKISDIRASVGAVCFSLYRRVLHPELFVICARQRLSTEKYELVIWATERGHVASIVSGRTVLTEVTGAPGQELPKGGLVEQFKLYGTGRRRCGVSFNMSYLCDVKAETMSATQYRQNHIGMERFARNRGIFTRFGQRRTGELSPFGYVDFEARRDELQIHTLTANPQARTIIKTLSRVGF